MMTPAAHTAAFFVHSVSLSLTLSEIFKLYLIVVIIIVVHLSSSILLMLLRLTSSLNVCEINFIIYFIIMLSI